MVNIYRKVIGANISHQMLRNFYTKSSLSYKLRNLKIMKYYIFKFYKFKYFSALESFYLTLVRFSGLYLLKFFKKSTKLLNDFIEKSDKINTQNMLQFMH
jgi:hypothetical protein